MQARQQSIRDKNKNTLTDYQIIKQYANLPEGGENREMRELCELTRTIISLKNSCLALELSLVDDDEVSQKTRAYPAFVDDKRVVFKETSSIGRDSWCGVL